MCTNKEKKRKFIKVFDVVIREVYFRLSNLGSRSKIDIIGRILIFYETQIKLIFTYTVIQIG